MKNRDNPLVLNALKFFTKNPYEKVYVREFARKLSISPNTANRFLNYFLENNLLQEEKIANLRYFKANLKSQTFRQIKKTINIHEIESTNILDQLNPFCFNLVLFGSCANGTDDSTSDFDFLIISKKKQEIREIFSKNEKKFSKEISLHIFTPLEWKEQKNKNKAFYQDIVSTGINLIGQMPLLN
jgi:predicted nucleotidyltransferase